MQLLMFVTKKEEKIDELMKELALSDIRGATVLSSTGMANSIKDMEELPMFDVLATMLKGEKEMSSKTILFAVKDSKVDEARRAINKVFGDLSTPNSGILLGIPVTFFEGLKED